jgi:hypothetical protein
VSAWARVLASPAQHGWVARDVNQLIRDWIGVGHWLPDAPHKPIGLLYAMMAWHGADHLTDRPAAADMACEAAELAAHRTRLAAQRAERDASLRARVVGRAALGGPGHVAARATAAEAAHRALLRRTQAAAAEAARLDAAVRAARGITDHGFESR